MRTAVGIGTVLVLALAPTVVPTAAVAATGEFGNSCVATGQMLDSTFLITGKSGSNPLPVGAPFAGVITKVVVTMPAVVGDGPYPMQLKVARPTSNPDEYQTIAASPTLDTGQGARPFSVRVPVTAGDLIGLSGMPAYCDTANVADTVHMFPDEKPVGDVSTYGEQTSRSVPVVATVEPDADGDGYGDITQDQCPQVKALHICPPLRLDAFAFPTGNTITVLVATSEKTKVSVTGTTKVDGKTVKLSAKPKKVAPGTLGKISLKLPAALKAALAELPSSRSIQVTITSSGKGLNGKTRTDKTKVKLPGTG